MTTKTAIGTRVEEGLTPKSYRAGVIIGINPYGVPDGSALVTVRWDSGETENAAGDMLRPEGADAPPTARDIATLRQVATAHDQGQWLEDCDRVEAGEKRALVNAWHAIRAAKTEGWWPA